MTPRGSTSPSAREAAAPARLMSREREASLYERLLNRDERALVELVDVATPWLLGLAQAMLSDPDEAEEVVQDSFTIVWNRIGLLQPDAGGLVPWLLRIARNRAIDRLRSRKRRRLKAVRLKAYETGDEQVTPPGELNEAARPGWHVHESVHSALSTLPEEQRVAVRLAYFQGLTHSEISRELDIPMGTVKTRLRLAFDKLRVALAPIRDWVL
ncbi:MAG: RNA polymerase sigma factor [Gemmatimonadales bacterium]